MTDVRPFRGLRYDPGVVPDWGAVLAPPFDVISPPQREALIARSPYQITQIETATSSQGGPQGGAEAADLLRAWRRDGVLVRDADPGYYVAQHGFPHDGRAHVRTTLYAAVRLSPWADAQVLPHEWTMSGPKKERQKLRQDVRADISPLMSLAPDRRGAVAATLTAPGRGSGGGRGRRRGPPHALTHYGRGGGGGVARGPGDGTAVISPTDIIAMKRRWRIAMPVRSGRRIGAGRSWKTSC